MLPTAVIDNTLLSCISKLDLAKFLPFIFSKILIPPEVRREAYKAPNRRRLRNLLGEMSGFFVACIEADLGNQEYLKTIVDEGEAAVIAQAEAKDAAVITDDKAAYKQAHGRELQVYRTGKILCLLKEAAVIPNVKPYLDTLVRQMRFNLSKADKEAILNEAGE